MHRLSSAAMQPSIACASPGARVQEQSTCALLLLHRGTVCMSPGAPARMRAAAGLRTYARAAARAQPVHIHGFSCTHGDMRAHAGAAVDLRVVSSPRISIGPAGSRINRDHARRGWATETGHPSWGPRDPRQDKLCAASPPRRSRCGRPRFARRQVRIHTCERSRLCVVSTAPCPHPRGSHVLLLRRPTMLPPARGQSVVGLF